MENFEEDEALLARIAHCYYQDNATQSQIGERFGLSRIKVSRLLEQARQTGMVQIRINSAYEGCFTLEETLKQQWQLKDIRIIPDWQGRNLNQALGQAAAQYLMQCLQPNDLLAIGWGVTVSHAVRQLGFLANSQNITLASLTGGVAAYVDGMRSANWNSDVYIAPAPLIVADAQTALALQKESSIRNIFDMAMSSASYQLVGIGEITEDATIVQSGYISRSDAEPLRRKGAVGDILCRFFDHEGKLLDLELHRRVIGVGLHELRQSQRLIAAAGGHHKISAIRAALTGGYIDILITDENTAKQLTREEAS